MKKKYRIFSKKFFLYATCFFGLVFGLYVCYGENTLNQTWTPTETEKFPYANIISNNEIDYTNPQTDLRNMLKTEIIEPESYKQNPQGGYFKGFLEFLSIQRFTADTRDGEPYTENKSAIAYITYIINVGIALSVFIALLFIIYGFFSMIFTKDEEGFAKAKKIVINSAIAIGIIGISWFIISILFYTYSKVSDINRPDYPKENINTKQNIEQNNELQG